MPRSAKGSRRERELLEYLTARGLVVHRVAGSGLHENAICDLIAIDSKGHVQLIEVKSRKTVYYPNDHAGQLQELVRVARSCRAVPLLAVKLNYKQWQFIDLRRGVPDRVG